MDPEISTIQNGGGEREEGQGQGAHARDQHWSGIKEVHKDLDQLSRDQRELIRKASSLLETYDCMV